MSAEEQTTDAGKNVVSSRHSAAPPAEEGSRTGRDACGGGGPDRANSLSSACGQLGNPTRVPALCGLQHFAPLAASRGIHS